MTLSLIWQLSNAAPGAEFFADKPAEFEGDESSQGVARVVFRFAEDLIASFGGLQDLPYQLLCALELRGL